MTSRFQVRIRILSREVGIPLLSLNELEKKSQAIIILDKFVNKPNSHWLVVFGKCFSLMEI